MFPDLSQSHNVVTSVPAIMASGASDLHPRLADCRSGRGKPIVQRSRFPEGGWGWQRETPGEPPAGVFDGPPAVAVRARSSGLVGARQRRGAGSGSGSQGGTAQVVEVPQIVYEEPPQPSPVLLCSCRLLCLHRQRQSWKTRGANDQSGTGTRQEALPILLASAVEDGGTISVFFKGSTGRTC